MGAPSSRAGMGAMPYGAGTTFRVWAPGAAGVAVAGPFTRWPGMPLASEPAGMWSADVPGAVPGQAYQVLLMTGAGTLTRVDPYARQVVNENGLATHAVIYDEGAFDWGDLSYSSPGWTDLVIYELHVGSFSERPGRRQAIWLMSPGSYPTCRSLVSTRSSCCRWPRSRARSRGDMTRGCLFSAERAYGGPDGLKAFVRAAHGLGIAVILNVVTTTSARRILFCGSSMAAGPAGGIYFYGARYPGDPRPQTPWGSRPDYGRAEVRQYLVDNAVSWLRDYRLDGLRLDATAYIRNIFGDGDPSQDIPDGWQLLQQINDAIDGSQPWKITIAEDMQDNDWITRPTAAQGAGFDAQWDPHFVQQVRAVLEQDQDADRDMRAIQAALEQRYAASAYVRVVFTESHDADGNGRTRVPTEIDPAQPDSYWAKKRSTLGGALVLPAPGVPMLFQGQEFLEQRPFLQDPAPLDWGNVTTYAGILALYRDLIHLRRDLSATTRGLRGENCNVYHINDAAKVIAFHRFDQGGPGDDAIVVFNFANLGYASYQVGLPRPGTWRVRFNSDWSGYDPTFGNWASNDTAAAGTPQDGLAYSGPIGLGPYTAVILSQDPAS